MNSKLLSLFFLLPILSYFPTLSASHTGILPEQFASKNLSFRAGVATDRQALERMFADKDTKNWFFHDPNDTPWLTDQICKQTDYSKVYKLICSKNDAQIVGIIYLSHKNDQNGVTGYVIDKPFRGKGFATEAVKTVLEHGFKAGFDNIEAEVFMGNEASEKVLQKCGFTVPQFWARNGNRSTGWFYITKKDFEHHQKNNWLTVKHPDLDVPLQPAAPSFLPTIKSFMHTGGTSPIISAAVVTAAAVFYWFKSSSDQNENII